MKTRVILLTAVLPAIASAGDVSVATSRAKRCHSKVDQGGAARFIVEGSLLKQGSFELEARLQRRILRRTAPDFASRAMRRRRWRRRVWRAIATISSGSPRSRPRHANSRFGATIRTRGQNTIRSSPDSLTFSMTEPGVNRR